MEVVDLFFIKRSNRDINNTTLLAMVYLQDMRDILYILNNYGLSPFAKTLVIFFALVMTIWTFFWKGAALWQAAKQNQKIWFVIFLVLNTFGIVEIIYLFFFAKERVARTCAKNLYHKVRSKVLKLFKK